MSSPFSTLAPLFVPAVQNRVVLLINHLLLREPLAAARLKPLAGQALSFTVQDWPQRLPAPPDLNLRITPAGLFERLEAGEEKNLGGPGLRVQIQASNPLGLVLGLMKGQRPGIQVSGDAALASELNWLLDHLRWDAQDDLASLLGPLPASVLAELGRGLRTALTGWRERAPA